MNQRKIQLIELTPEEFKSEILIEIRSELQDLYQKMKAQEETKWLSRQETADKLGVSFVTLHKWNYKGILHAHKMGGKVLYKLSDVEEKLSKS